MIAALLLPVFATALHSEESVVGQVLEADVGRGGLVVQFEEEAEPRFVKVSAGDLEIGFEGDFISGTLTKSGEEAFLTSIRPAGPILINAMSGVNRSLLKEAAQMGRSESLSRGDYLPNFALFNQRGQAVFARDLRNQPTVLSFIFTRCGDPVMCPATTARMAGLGERLAEAGLTEPKLVLISFDPDYDTPGVLRQYAKAYGMESDQFELLTGDEETTNALMRLSGMRTIHEDGTIIHNLVTLLTDDHGRIVLRQDGSRWSADAIFQRLTASQDQEG